MKYFYIIIIFLLVACYDTNKIKEKKTKENTTSKIFKIDSITFKHFEKKIREEGRSIIPKEWINKFTNLDSSFYKKNTTIFGNYILYDGKPLNPAQIIPDYKYKLAHLTSDNIDTSKSIFILYDKCDNELSNFILIKNYRINNKKVTYTDITYLNDIDTFRIYVSYFDTINNDTKKHTYFLKKIKDEEWFIDNSFSFRLNNNYKN